MIIYDALTLSLWDSRKAVEGASFRVGHLNKMWYLLGRGGGNSSRTTKFW